jgi:hypothetical protein
MTRGSGRVVTTPASVQAGYSIPHQAMGMSQGTSPKAMGPSVSA